MCETLREALAEEGLRETISMTLSSAVLPSLEDLKKNFTRPEMASAPQWSLVSRTYGNILPRLTALPSVCLGGCYEE